jgi:hypothetical protein
LRFQVRHYTGGEHLSDALTAGFGRNEHVGQPCKRNAVSHDASVGHLLSSPDVVDPVVPRGVDSCILLLTTPTLRPVGLLAEPLVYAATINFVRFGGEKYGSDMTPP